MLNVQPLLANSVVTPTKLYTLLWNRTLVHGFSHQTISESEIFDTACTLGLPKTPKAWSKCYYKPFPDFWSLMQFENFSQLSRWHAKVPPFSSQLPQHHFCIWQCSLFSDNFVPAAAVIICKHFNMFGIYIYSGFGGLGVA